VRILIIEDDNQIGSFLKRSFKEHGIVSDIAHDGRIGLSKALNSKYDAVVLDLSIAEYSGKDICLCVRQEKIETPILILTAHHSTDTKIELLTMGADDYITKPFVFDELLARIKAVVRRSKNEIIEKNLLKILDLEIDHEKMSVVRAGKSIFLTSKEYNLLCFLAENKGKVLSRTSILRHIWDSPLDILATTVDVHISILRKKIDKDFSEKLIHTVSGVGYKLDVIGQ